MCQSQLPNPFISLISMSLTMQILQDIIYAVIRSCEDYNAVFLADVEPLISAVLCSTVTQVK